MRAYTPKDDVQAKAYYTDRFYVSPQVPKQEVSSDAVFAADLEAISAKFEVKDGGVKKDPNRERMYAEISASDSEGTTDVGPIYIFIENGYPSLEISDAARNGWGEHCYDFFNTIV